jgi:hypothetical protein
MKAETYVGYSENLFISAFVGWMSKYYVFVLTGFEHCLWTPRRPVEATSYFVFCVVKTAPHASHLKFTVINIRIIQKLVMLLCQCNLLKNVIKKTYVSWYFPIVNKRVNNALKFGKHYMGTVSMFINWTGLTLAQVWSSGGLLWMWQQTF